MKASVYIATSLDGFIARLDGSIDWLDEPPKEGDGLPEEEAQEDYGYAEFMDTVDALVMGRNSFETVLGFGVDWPYSKPVIVLSTGSLTIPENLADRVEHMNSTPSETVSQLASRGMRHLYIDGGKTIQGFLNAGLIQRIIITRIPVLIGTGIPLFGPLQEDIRLRHVKTRSFPDGLVQEEYEIEKQPN